MNSREFFRKFLNHVIDWNQTFGTDFSKERLNLQFDITLSEIEETNIAISKNNIFEIIDGIGDIIVTSGYLSYIQTQKNDYIYEYLFDQSSLIKSIVIDMEKLILSRVIPPTHMIYQLLVSAQNEYGVVLVNDYLMRILKSNESKFVPEENFDSEYELKRAIERYGKEFKNIVVCDGIFRDKKIKMLRADNGNGKLLKPSTFIEPNNIKKW